MRRLCRAVFCLFSLLHEGSAAPFGEGFTFTPASSPLHPHKATVFGALRLPAQAPDGQPLHGLSGLAWSPANALLYAVSDQGYLVWLKPILEQGYLTGVEFQGRFALLDMHGEPLRGRARDAEGLAWFDGDSRPELLIAFEQQSRIARYAPDGKFHGNLTLPATLESRLRGAQANRGLEGLAWTAPHGFVTGLESPPSKTRNQLELYAGASRHVWQYSTAEAGGALVGLDTLPDGRLIALERRYLSPWDPLIISLRQIDLAHSPPQIQELARFSSTEGWAVDNFESIAWHTGQRFFMLSDDNGSPLQKTLLVYLSLPVEVFE